MSTHMQTAFAALGRMQSEVTIQPLHPGASAGQRLFFYKRLANEISPYAEEFELEVKKSEEAARLLNKTIFNIVDMLKDPQIRGTTDYDENVHRLRRIAQRWCSERLGDIDKMRSQASQLGRLSRDLRSPFSAIERGFDSLDAISAAGRGLGCRPPKNSLTD